MGAMGAMGAAAAWRDCSMTPPTAVTHSSSAFDEVT